jgi:hypothetical protein
MSYAQMEAMLIGKIADVRNSESSIARAFARAKAGLDVNGIDEQYAHLQEQIDEVEHLLSTMDSAAIRADRTYEFVPEPALQFSAAVRS